MKAVDRPTLSSEHVRMANWLKENWQKTVVAQKMNRKQVAKFLTALVGKHV